MRETSGQKQRYNTFVCQNKRPVCETPRETDGWSCLYSQRCTRRQGERDVCCEGGHGWGDVIDLTGPVSPEEREIQMDGQKQRCSRGRVALTDKIDQERGTQRGDRRIERD